MSKEVEGTEAEEKNKINHESTKEGKHEIQIFRVFIFSCFRDKKFFISNLSVNFRENPW